MLHHAALWLKIQALESMKGPKSNLSSASLQLLLTFSQPQFLHLYDGERKSTSSEDHVRQYM